MGSKSHKTAQGPRVVVYELGSVILRRGLLLNTAPHELSNYSKFANFNESSRVKMDISILVNYYLL
jgi:hypothetical protein